MARAGVAANETRIVAAFNAALEAIDIPTSGFAGTLAVRRTGTWAANGPEPGFSIHIGGTGNSSVMLANGGTENRISLYVRVNGTTTAQLDALAADAVPLDTWVQIFWSIDTAGNFVFRSYSSTQTVIAEKTGTITATGPVWTDATQTMLLRVPSGSSAYSYCDACEVGELVLIAGVVTGSAITDLLTRDSLPAETVYAARISPDGSPGLDPEPEEIEDDELELENTSGGDPAAVDGPAWMPAGSAAQTVVVPAISATSGIVAATIPQIVAVGSVEATAGMVAPAAIHFRVRPPSIATTSAVASPAANRTISVPVVSVSSVIVGAVRSLSIPVAAAAAALAVLAPTVVAEGVHRTPAPMSATAQVVAPTVQSEIARAVPTISAAAAVAVPVVNRTIPVDPISAAVSGIFVSITQSVATPPFEQPVLDDAAITIHVSAAGSDTTGDGSIGSPYRTPARAWTDVVDLRGDWIVLNRGDTFTGSLSIDKSGMSIASPIVIGAYGTGADPVWNHTVGSTPIANSGSRAFILLRHIDLFPTGWTPSTTPSGSSNGIQISSSPCASWVIEGCRIRGFGNGFIVSLNGSGAPYHDDITFRACQFHENGNHSFSNRARRLVVEYCNAGHSYSGVVGSPHAFYDNENNVDSDYRYNTYRRVLGAATNEVRGVNCTFRDSYFLECNDSMWCGVLTLSLKTHSNILRNVIDGATNVRSTIILGARGTTGTTRVRYNLGVNGPAGLSFIDLRQQPSSSGCDDLEVVGNVTGGFYDTFLSLGGSGDHSAIDFRENRAVVVGAVVTESDALAAAEFDSVQNTLFTPVGGTSQATWNGTGMTVAAFYSAVGDSGSTFAVPTFTDPTRDGKTYLDFILGTTGSTNDDLIALLDAQSATSWNPALSAPSINTWIQTGFDMPELSGTLAQVVQVNPVVAATAVLPPVQHVTVPVAAITATTAANPPSIGGTTTVAVPAVAVTAAVVAPKVGVRLRVSPLAVTSSVRRYAGIAFSVKAMTASTAVRSPSVQTPIEQSILVAPIEATTAIIAPSSGQHVVRSVTAIGLVSAVAAPAAPAQTIFSTAITSVSASKSPAVQVGGLVVAVVTTAQVEGFPGAGEVVSRCLAPRVITGRPAVPVSVLRSAVRTPRVRQTDPSGGGGSGGGGGGGTVIPAITAYVWPDTIAGLLADNTKLDNRLLDAASRIIRRLGKTITLIEENKVYDPATGEITLDTEEHVVQSTPPYPYRMSRIDGDLVRRDDAGVTLAALDLDFDPVVGMAARIDSALFRVIRVEPVYSGHRVAIWTLQLRR